MKCEHNTTDIEGVELWQIIGRILYDSNDDVCPACILEELSNSKDLRISAMAGKAIDAYNNYNQAEETFFNLKDGIEAECDCSDSIGSLDIHESTLKKKIMRNRSHCKPAKTVTLSNELYHYGTSVEIDGSDNLPF